MGRDYRNWFLTYHLDDSTGSLRELGDRFKRQLETIDLVVNYYLFGEEVGKAGITPHLQGVIQFEQRLTLVTLKKKFPKEIHWELCRDLTDAINYCSKEQRFIWTDGQAVIQGERTDINDAIRQVLNGVKTYRDMIAERPMFMAQYGRRIRDMQSYIPHVGRSHYREYPITMREVDQVPEDAFIYQGSWAGYDGQKKVLIFMDSKINLVALSLPKPYVNVGYERVPFYGEDVYVYYPADTQGIPVWNYVETKKKNS